MNKNKQYSNKLRLILFCELITYIKGKCNKYIECLICHQFNKLRKIYSKVNIIEK